MRDRTGQDLEPGRLWAASELCVRQPLQQGGFSPADHPRESCTSPAFGEGAPEVSPAMALLLRAMWFTAPSVPLLQACVTVWKGLPWPLADSQLWGLCPFTALRW